MAVVNYASNEACVKDFDRRKTMRLAGRTLVVTYRSRKHKEARAAGNTAINKAPAPTPAPEEKKPQGVDRTAIFIRGLAKKTTVAELRSLFPKSVGLDMPTNGRVCRG